jgi:hypothetical protein
LPGLNSAGYNIVKIYNSEEFIMKSNLKCKYGVIAVISLVLGLMVVSVPPVWAKNSNPGVIPLNAKAHGSSYGEWSAKWWQWALSLPVDHNPFFDETGCANGAQGQSGPVWFLTGVVNETGTAVRDCTVPAGKTLFFPVLNVEADNFFPPNLVPLDIAGLRNFAASIMDLASNLSVELDGNPIQNVASYRVQSPVFGVLLPDNNVEQYFGFIAPPGEYAPMVGDGYYIMLAPLSAGSHILHFHGEVPAYSFTLDITYNITVAPGQP